MLTDPLGRVREYILWHTTAWGAPPLTCELSDADWENACLDVYAMARTSRDSLKDFQWPDVLMYRANTFLLSPNHMNGAGSREMRDEVKRRIANAEDDDGE